jgi:hypothetical protein
MRTMSSKDDREASWPPLNGDEYKFRAPAPKPPRNRHERQSTSKQQCIATQSQLQRLTIMTGNPEANLT